MSTQTERIQTAFRFTPELLTRIRHSARKEGLSVNRYVEKELDKATELVFPKYPPDMEADEGILAFAGRIHLEPFSKEEVDANPKLAYLINKNGL